MARLVFIPQEAQPSQDVTVMVSPPPAYDREGNPLPMAPFPLTIPMPKNVQNAFWEAATWYGCTVTHGVREDEIRFKFFDRRDFITWIETNLDGTILVQSSTNGSWTLAFSDPASHRRFTRWWAEIKHLGSIPAFDATEAEFNEMKEWVRENVRGRHKLERSYGWSANRTVRVTSAFEDLDEAVAFKMVWYDPTVQ